METPELIVQLRSCLGEIPNLKKIQEGFGNPHVKAWKTKLEGILKDGGTTCRESLNTLNRIKSKLCGTDFVKHQTFLNQLDALERNLKQTIQTISLFGRPEDKPNLPVWAKPKSQKLATGVMMVGDEAVSTASVSIHEVLDCLVSLSEDSNHLTAEMRDIIINHLKSILDDDLLQPFLSQKLDVLLGHWPEFQTK